MPILTHKKPSVLGTDHVTHLLGVSTSTGISLTTHSGIAQAVAITKVNATGSGWLVKTQAYSYDGVILTESYLSDI